MERLIPSSFGEMLKALRCRQRITQQRLAERLGVHRNTIGTWERGNVLPESKGIVLELARQLHLDNQETRQLLEASLTALAPYWAVPSPRNPFFTGREEILEELHRRLGPNQAIALTQSHAVYGLGGIGKTQIAVEYAYRHVLEYSAVLWIGAETVESIMAGFLHLAEALQLPERHEADQQRVVEAVQHWLSTHKNWLLIWDNLEEMELLLRFLPPTRQGAVLATTRMQAFGTLAQGVTLSTMGGEEGLLFLLRRAKVLSQEMTSEHLHQFALKNPTEYAAAQELVTVLGGLPLALDQAAAYVEETGCNLSVYLQHYEKQHGSFLQRRGILAYDHPHSVAATFLLAFERVERVCPAAADLLRMCVFLHADEIPEELFLIDAPHLGPTLAHFSTDPSQLDLALAVLRTFSLIQRHPETRTCSLHRLVQMVLRERMDTVTSRSWVEHVVSALNAAFPGGGEFETWQRCERLVMHAQACQQWIEQRGISSSEAARLLHEAGVYQTERGHYPEAQSFLIQALALRERIYGPDHPHVAMTLDRLAWCFECQGKYEQAEPLYQRALTICEACLGPDNPSTADLLNNVGSFLRKLGRYEQAEALLQRAVILGERLVHPETATYLSNLARLARDRGKYEQAESLLQRVLDLHEQRFGPTHPRIATCLHNLAYLCKDQGKYEQAESLGLRALAMYEQQLGPTHPHTAVCLYNLAELARIQGHDEQAELLFHRVLAIEQQRLGASHPSTATTLQSLAKLSMSQGKYEQAESLFQQVLAIRVEHLGPDHLDTAESFHSLAALYEKQGLDEQALSFFQTAVSQEPDPFKNFLAACCELHPHAWSRASDLWQAYEQWVEAHQERYPFSRRAFIAQLKAHGCRADRTKTARIWRGIALVKKDDDGR